MIQLALDNKSNIYFKLIKAWLDVFHGRLQEESLPWKAAFGGTALSTNGSLGGNTMSVLLSGSISNTSTCAIH